MNKSPVSIERGQVARAICHIETASEFARRASAALPESLVADDLRVRLALSAALESLQQAFRYANEGLPKARLGIVAKGKPDQVVAQLGAAAGEGAA